MSPHTPDHVSPASNPPAGAPNSGRAADGHFAPGNPGGPGNPFARRTAAFHVGLASADTNRLGRHEIDVVSAGPAMRGQLQGAMQAMLPENRCDMAQATRPPTSAARAEQYLECLTTGELPEAVEDELDETWAEEEVNGGVPALPLKASSQVADRRGMAQRVTVASRDGTTCHDPRGVEVVTGCDGSCQGGGRPTVETVFFDTVARDVIRPADGNPGGPNRAGSGGNSPPAPPRTDY